MERRAFIGTLAGGLLAAPLAVEAQPPKVPKIGVLSLDSPTSSVCVDALRRGLNMLTILLLEA